MGMVSIKLFVYFFMTSLKVVLQIWGNLASNKLLNHMAHAGAVRLMLFYWGSRGLIVV